MRVPNAGAAYVPAGKLTGYLLALGHPVGGPKARLFHAHGFDEARADELEARLLELVRTAEAERVESPHGTKYVADGDVQAPRGGFLRVRTVWVVEPGDPRPRFITAYPA